MIKKINTTQNWLPIDKIFSNGIILYKNKYFKILKIIPISYDLKSNLEKEAILNSYKIFLKTCNFDSQILIQSKKENLSKHFSKLEEQEKNYNENEFLDVFKNYYTYISSLNEKNKSSSKNFYFILKTEFKSDYSNVEKEATKFFNEAFLNIKESLSRCGNTVHEIGTKEEVEEILFSFYNLRLLK